MVKPGQTDRPIIQRRYEVSNVQHPEHAIGIRGTLAGVLTHSTSQ